MLHSSHESSCIQAATCLVSRLGTFLLCHKQQRQLLLLLSQSSQQLTLLGSRQLLPCFRGFLEFCCMLRRDHIHHRRNGFQASWDQTNYRDGRLPRDQTNYRTCMRHHTHVNELMGKASGRNRASCALFRGNLGSFGRSGYLRGFGFSLHDLIVCSSFRLNIFIIIADLPHDLTNSIPERLKQIALPPHIRHPGSRSIAAAVLGENLREVVKSIEITSASSTLAGKVPGGISRPKWIYIFRMFSSFGR